MYNYVTDVYMYIKLLHMYMYMCNYTIGPLQVQVHAEPPSIRFCPYFYGFVHTFPEIKITELQRHCFMRDPISGIAAALLRERSYHCSVKTEVLPTTPRHKYKPEQRGFVCYLKSQFLIHLGRA